MFETHPFGDFIPENIKYLILGSFAAKKRENEANYDWFYGSSRNQFWPIIRAVYNLPLLTVQEKQQLFRDLKLGITDIIYQCKRKDNNSLDSNLINIIYNPELENILKVRPIKKIFFTSRFVEDKFRKKFKIFITHLPKTELITLPSPSPRYARMTKEQKTEKYKILLPTLT